MTRDSIRDAILLEIAARPARTRRDGRRRSALIYGSAALAGVPLFFAWGGFGHGATRPLDLTIRIALGALLIVIACADVAWWRNRSAVGPPTAALLAIAALAPLATYAWLVLWHNHYAAPPARIGFRCMAMTLVSGGAMLGAALHLRKRTVVVDPLVAGAALGATAGAFAQVMVDIWCPLTNGEHALVGHAFPVAALAIAGGLIGGRVLTIRAFVRSETRGRSPGSLERLDCGPPDKGRSRD